MPTKIPAIEIDWDAIKTAFAPWLQRFPEFSKRYEDIPARHAQLQSDSLAQVKTWEIYTFPSHEIDPSYYLLGGYRPGRRLKTDPGPEAKMVRYGLDANGRKVIERWPNEVNIGEKILEYQAGRIDCTNVATEKTTGSLIYPHRIDSLYFENGRPMFFVQHSGSETHLRLFRHDEAGRIVQVLLASGVAGGSPNPKDWVYKFADATYDANGDARVRIFDGWSNNYEFAYKAPKSRAVKKKIPVLDLRKDVDDAVAMIEKAVTKFFSQQQKSGEVVSGIGLGFFASENPEVIIQFDTRPVFEPDGTWTHSEFARLKRPRWSKFIEACEEADGKGAVIDALGTRYEIAEIGQEARLVGWLGEAMVAALKTVRDSGAFKPLQKAARCELGVEEAGDGEFGWPRYEDRGKENLV